MKRILLSLTVAFAVTAGPAPGAGPARRPVDLALAPDPAASAQRVARALESEELWWGPLTHEKGETILVGRPAEPLPPGRYRLHAQVGLVPRGHVLADTARFHLEAGGAEREIDPAELAADGTPVDCTLDFRVDGSGDRPRVRIGWHVMKMPLGDDTLKNARGTAIFEAEKPDSAPGGIDDGPSDLFGGDGGPALSLEEDDGRASLAALNEQAPYRAMVWGAHIERRSPVAIERVETDRITYPASPPHRPGRATVLLRNHAAAPQSVALRVAFSRGLAPEAPMHEGVIEVPAGGTASWEGDFATDGLRWGAGIRAAAQVGDYAPEVRRTAFAVPRNFWETAMMAANLEMPRRPNLSAEAARELARETRRRGYTGFELFFWAPCDMIDFTPEGEHFWGCQGAYPGTVSGTRHLIEAAHERGIAATVYANLWGAAGPPGFDLMRRHPDWFGQANFKQYHLDDWELFASGEQRGPTSCWQYVQVQLQAGMDIFDRHAKEIVDSHEMFGWDATRYDSYYSAAWTKRATARVRQRVEAAVPDYQWGYNSQAVRDRNRGALPIMVGGGGLVMEEALGRTTGQGPLRRYAGRILELREIVWQHGGHLGVIFDGGKHDGPNRPDKVLAAAVLLAGGAHPYYSWLGGGLQRFGLRYSELLWDNRSRPLADPRGAVTLEGGTDYFLWPRFARTLTRAQDAHRLILHLVNVDDDFRFGEPDAQVREPVRGQAVRVALPEGARVEGAWAIDAPGGHVALDAERAGGGALRLTVPEVRRWTIVVVDYTGPQPIAPAKQGKAEKSS